VKRVGKLCLCLAGGLVLNTGVRAEVPSLPGNPYAPIVARNVFNITPPPPVDPNASTEPPPKITPNGITSAYGRLQVLFKVAVPPKPGQPGKEQYYILSTGQAQDDIEVRKIDEKAGIVTFNNHGTIQELPLIVGTASGGSSEPASGGPSPGPGPNKPGFASAGGNANGGGFTRFGSRFGQSGGFGGQNPKNNGANNSANNANSGVMLGGSGANFGSTLGGATANSGLSSQSVADSTSSGSSSTQSQGPPLTPDQVRALIAANLLAAEQRGDATARAYPNIFDSQAGNSSSHTAGGSTSH